MVCRSASQSASQSATGQRQVKAMNTFTCDQKRYCITVVHCALMPSSKAYSTGCRQLVCIADCHAQPNTCRRQGEVNARLHIRRRGPWPGCTDRVFSASSTPLSYKSHTSTPTSLTSNATTSTQKTSSLSHTQSFSPIRSFPSLMKRH